MYRRTKGYAMGGKVSKYMAKGGMAKGTKYMAKGGVTAAAKKVSKAAKKPSKVATMKKGGMIDYRKKGMFYGGGMARRGR